MLFLYLTNILVLIVARTRPLSLPVGPAFLISLPLHKAQL